MQLLSVKEPRNICTFDSAQYCSCLFQMLLASLALMVVVLQMWHVQKRNALNTADWCDVHTA
jgi:hypothetical protein